MPLDSRNLPDESDGEVLPGPPGGTAGSMREWAQELVGRARVEGVDLTGEGGLLTSMVREVLQAGLDVEMSEHLGYEPYEATGRGSGNTETGATQRRSRRMSGRWSSRCPATAKAPLSRSPCPSTPGDWKASGRMISLYAIGQACGSTTRARPDLSLIGATAPWGRAAAVAGWSGRG